MFKQLRKAFVYFTKPNAVSGEKSGKGAEKEIVFLNRGTEPTGDGGFFLLNCYKGANHRLCALFIGLQNANLLLKNIY